MRPPCARYYPSDGTLCSTHHGRFATPSANRCDIGSHRHHWRWEYAPAATEDGYSVVERMVCDCGRIRADAAA